MLVPLLQNNLLTTGGGGGPTPIVSSCLVVSLVIDTPMTPATMVATGGDGGPYVFSAIGLPSGLSLSLGGTLSGTPTEGGVFGYQVSIGDPSGDVTVLTCSLNVSTVGLPDDGLGIIRYLGDISNAVVEETWTDGYGDLVQVDGINIFEDFGIIGPCYRENQNLRIEYQRHGLALDEAPFEIPDRYVTYVRHYVLARALEREGPAQDLKLAAHFQARWEAGIERMKKRKEAMAFQRLQVMGGRDSVRGQKPPRPKLPPSYGTVVR